MNSWILKWAHTPYGPVALFLLAFAESIFFPLPADVLLIVLVIGFSARAFQYALICTIGSVLGALVGYTVGHFAWLQANGDFTGFANFFFQNIPGFTIDLFNHIKELYNRWDFWVIFTAGFAPVPYKVFTITAGVFDINFFMFLLASSISRGARFFLISFLIWKYGTSIKLFIERYFHIIALGLTACLVVGFITFKYFV